MNKKRAIWICIGLLLLVLIAIILITERNEYARIEEQRQINVHEQQLLDLSINSAPLRNKDGIIDLDYSQVNYTSLWIKVAVYNEHNTKNITVEELLYAFANDADSQITADYFYFYSTVEHENLYIYYLADLMAAYSTTEFLVAYPEYKNVDFRDLTPEDLEILAAYEQTVGNSSTR